MEYKKENRKSKRPTSIRFNDLQTSIALSKSGKESKQQLVDFLIDRYINGENPVLERQQVFDAPPLPKNYIDEPKQWKEPQVIKNWQYYMNLIPDIKTIDGCKKLDTEIKMNTLLLPNERKILQSNLITHSKTLYTD